MTQQIGERSWTYYEGGQYPCTCFFCENRIATTEARWHSPSPSSLYMCPECERVEAGALSARYPPQKALEVPVDAKSAPGVGKDTPEAVYAPTSREMAISKAHEENMEASENMRREVRNLWQVVERLCNIMEANR